MFKKCLPFALLCCIGFISTPILAQVWDVDKFKLVWNSPSANSGESMPCGGGDIGLNIWVEKGELFFYIARSGQFDEHNALLKSGRVRVKLSPNPFEGKTFQQTLNLNDGDQFIEATNGNHHVKIRFWVDVFAPVIRMNLQSNQAITVKASYESWRHKDRPTVGGENNANSYKWAPPVPVITRRDSIKQEGDAIVFFHRNATGPNVFDRTVQQQGLDSVKDELFDPLTNLCFGGIMMGKGMRALPTDTGTYANTDFKAWPLQTRKPVRNQQLMIVLHTNQSPTEADWRNELDASFSTAQKQEKQAALRSKQWWNNYWQRSFIDIDASQPDTSKILQQVSANYQLFRYMLGCNVQGKYPTKFNGGLFTVDPVHTNPSFKFTPDYRSWGGGTYTAQNQRLVHFPMFKNGDFDLLQPQLEFYMRLLKTAEIRSRVYWSHGGASFCEQLENFGLPNCTEYGWKRPAGYDKGMEYNAWLEYQWDTVLEFCLMMLDMQRYFNQDISRYIPFVESCLQFFNEHYPYLARKLGARAYDGAGKLILFPGSAAETYKMAYNANSTIAGLQTILDRLLILPDSLLSANKKLHWDSMRQRIPPLNYRQLNGHTVIAPALSWQRINNTETPQLYPIYPWGIFGVGKAGLDTALNTWRNDTDAIKFRGHAGWRQDNIFAARLGLRDEAAHLNVLKMNASGRRFPAFWGPGYDWVPDHNWGGAGMIGLQEMLLQTDDRKIMLFPAWPKNWDVHFKLHAPYQTTVEARLKNGKLVELKVLPEERMKDVVNMLE